MVSYDLAIKACEHQSCIDIKTSSNNLLINKYLPFMGKHSPKNAHRLFCFPFAGGSASNFQLLRKNSPDYIDVQPLQLPGRENRFSEKPHDTIDEILDDLRKVLTPFIHEPYSLLGYSLGAHVAHAFIGDLQKRQLPLPQKLIVAARRAPSAPARHTGLHKLPSALFWQQLAQYEGTSSEVLNNPELRALLEPMLRADFALSDHPCSLPGPIPTSIVALAGSDDPFASPTEMAGWTKETQGNFNLVVVEGSHFFIRTNADSFVHHVCRQFADAGPYQDKSAATSGGSRPEFQEHPAI